MKLPRNKFPDDPQKLAVRETHALQAARLTGAATLGPWGPLSGRAGTGTLRGSNLHMPDFHDFENSILGNGPTDAFAGVGVPSTPSYCACAREKGGGRGSGWGGP